MLENVPRRKHGVSRRWSVAIALLALVMVAGVTALLLAKPPAPDLPPKEDHSVLLRQAAKDDLKSITITQPGRSSYRLLVNDGLLSVPDTDGFVMDAALQERMISTLLYVEALDDLGPLTKEDWLHLEDYGLGQSAFGLSIDYADGTSLDLHIGDRIPGELPEDYLLVGGQDRLYSIAVDVRNTFDRRLNQLHHVPRIDFSTELLDRVDFQGTDALTLVKLASGTWQMEQPITAPADVVAIQRLLKQINAMRFAAFVTDATPESLAGFGLLNPRSSVTFYLAPSVISEYSPEGQLLSQQSVAEQSITISFGDEVPGVGFYCLYNDTVYQSTDLSMGFLYRMDPRSFIGKHPVDLPLSSLKRFLWRIPGYSRDYGISLVESILPNNELARDEAGEVLHEYLITYEDIEVPAEDVAEAYSQLMSLSGSGPVPADFSPQGEPLLAVELHHANGIRSVVFWSLDTLSAAVEVNGSILYSIEKHALNAAISGLKKL